MKTAVDTNVLLDLLAGSPDAAAASRQALASTLAAGLVVVCPAVYAELSAAFGDRDEVNRFIGDLQLRLEDFSTDALFEAAGAWKRYSARRGTQVQCSRCGHKANLGCPACQAPLAWRQHIITDFLVGGHALRQADGLLTRDVGYYRGYFPDLRLIAPAPAVS